MIQDDLTCSTCNGDVNPNSGKCFGCGLIQKECDCE